MTALQRQSIDTTTSQEQLGKLFTFEDKKARYLKGYIAWSKIKRATAPEYCKEKTKLLSKDARHILAIVVSTLRKGDRAIFNHKYLSSLTECKKRQNINIIHQLSDVLDIIYHNSVTHKGKKYRYSYEFCYKSQTQENRPSIDNSITQKIAEQDAPLYIDKNKDIEYIDLQSNFKNNSEEEKEPQKVQAKVYHFNQNKLPKKLSDFYPISYEDCCALQILSGREFSLNAMNQILLDMSKRRTGPIFYSKKGFLAYMGKAFAYEKRDAVKISNENFKIKANISQEEKKAAEINKYLEEIEYSRQVTPEWHLKKKLACVLEPIKAYYLLKAYRSIEIEGGIAKLNLYHNIYISPGETQIVLSQIRATHERFVDGEYNAIEKVEFIANSS